MSRCTDRILSVVVVLVLSSLAVAASPPSQFVSGNDYTDSYYVSGNVVTRVTGGGWATFSGFWDARRDSKTLWKAEGSNLYVDADAQMDNNFNYLIYASRFQIEGLAGNTGASNEIFEFDPAFSMDRGTGVFGDTEGTDPGTNLVGGLTTMRVHNARLVTHASQNLPTSWKRSPDPGAWYPGGDTHVSHHGLLIFADIIDFDGTSTNTTATSSEWYVRSNDQTYDGGLYWRNDWRLDVEAGVTLSSNTHFEQAVVGPHVGFGTRPGETGTTLTKTGDGALVIARGGIQGYSADTTIDIQQGRVEFNSNENTHYANYYLDADIRNARPSVTGQYLTVQVADGAEVDFHAYTYPIDENWWSGGDYGPDSMHEIEQLDAAGTVRLGGLWTPSDDEWDQAYYDLFESGMASPTGEGPSLDPETALAREARLNVAGNLTLHATSAFEIVLGADSAFDAWQVTVGGTLTQAGELVIIDDGTLGVGEYDLFDAGGFAGDFDALVLPAGWAGTYSPVDGELSITAIPEPATMGLLAIGGLGALLRRRR